MNPDTPRHHLRKAIHWAIRILILLLFVVLSCASLWSTRILSTISFSTDEADLVWSGPFILQRFLPSFSPFVAMMGMIARREWTLWPLWLIPPLLVVIMALWKGTWFCRWCCPLGTLQTLQTRASLKRQILKRNLGGYILFASLFGALLGFPLFMIFDPLAISARVFPAFLQEGSTTEYIAAGTVLLILLAGFIQPLLWCVRICPLGYMQRLLHRLRFIVSCKEDACSGFKPVRRELLIGAAIGIPAALLLRKFATAQAAPPILPPGAKDAQTFAGTCSRCYACVNACSTGVLQVSPAARNDLAHALEPELDFSRGAVCDYGCNNCSHACPTAALAPLTMEQKRERQIGLAAVERNLCMGWADEIDCMACANQCPYGAIKANATADGVPRPEVDADLCRGCGYCQTACPIPETAIRVHGVRTQRQLPPATTKG